VALNGFKTSNSLQMKRHVNRKETDMFYMQTHLSEDLGLFCQSDKNVV